MGGGVSRYSRPVLNKYCKVIHVHICTTNIIMSALCTFEGVSVEYVSGDVGISEGSKYTVLRVKKPHEAEASVTHILVCTGTMYMYVLCNYKPSICCTIHCWCFSPKSSYMYKYMYWCKCCTLYHWHIPHTHHHYQHTPLSAHITYMYTCSCQHTVQ